jgi:hypothetical protein
MSASYRSRILAFRVAGVVVVGTAYVLMLAPGGAGWIAHGLVTLAVAGVGVLAAQVSDKGGGAPFLSVPRAVQVALVGALLLSSVLVSLYGGPSPVVGGPWPPTVVITGFLYGSLWLAAPAGAEGR